MTFEAGLTFDDDIATITLSGELDRTSAPRLDALVGQVADRPALTRLVLLVEELSYMSSAGLRSLVFAHQQMPREVEIVILGAQAAVAETIRLTGFDQSVVLQEASGG